MQRDELDFDFTEDEMYRALRLVTSDTEAREQASAFAATDTNGMDWATSEDTLLLLSLGCESARARVNRIRRAMMESRRKTWMQQHTGDSDLVAGWENLLARENEDWDRRLAELRERLQAEGGLGGDPERN